MGREFYGQRRATSLINSSIQSKTPRAGEYQSNKSKFYSIRILLGHQHLIVIFKRTSHCLKMNLTSFEGCMQVKILTQAMTLMSPPLNGSLGKERRKSCLSVRHQNPKDGSSLVNGRSKRSEFSLGCHALNSSRNVDHEDCPGDPTRTHRS